MANEDCLKLARGIVMFAELVVDDPGHVVADAREVAGLEHRRQLAGGKQGLGRVGGGKHCPRELKVGVAGDPRPRVVGAHALEPLDCRLGLTQRHVRIADEVVGVRGQQVVAVPRHWRKVLDCRHVLVPRNQGTTQEIPGEVDQRRVGEVVHEELELGLRAVVVVVDEQRLAGGEVRHRGQGCVRYVIGDFFEFEDRRQGASGHGVRFAEVELRFR